MTYSRSSGRGSELSPSISSCCPLSTQDAGGASKTEEDEEEVLDEETLRRDQVIKGAIDVLIREYASELNAPSQDSDSQPRNKKRKEKKEEVHQCDAAALPVAAKFVCGAEVLSGFFFLLLFLSCEEDISAMEMEDDKRDLISREISKFRDTHKVAYHNAAVALLLFFLFFLFQRRKSKSTFSNENNPQLS